MAPHDLILLSPYRYPAHSAMTLADDDMAAWLNGATALWHPAVVWQAQGAPKVDSPYDHEQPRAGAIYCVPETPPSYLPDDWDERVRAAGAVAFRSTPDRASTLANLRAALTADGAPAVGWAGGFDLPDAAVGPFFGLGLGQLLQAALAEAMEHENLLDPAAFWDDVQRAVAALAGHAYTPAAVRATAEPHHVASEDQEPPAPDANGQAEAPVDVRTSLQAAATRLLSAREVLYPVTIHLLDLVLLDEKTLDQPWPADLDAGPPLNVLAPTALLETLAERHPDKFDGLRQAVQAERAEVIGGSYLEREDPLLPLDSQLWNLRHGLDRAKELLGAEVRVYGRQRFGYHPHLPLLLSTNGLTRTLMLTFDETSGLPHYTQAVVSWPSPDGKQVDAFVRAPKPAHSPETFFNLGHSWFKTTREDHAATLALVHADRPAAPWYHDLMALASLAPVVGTWETFTQFFNTVTAGEYPSALSADDFHFDVLSERVEAHRPDPVSGFARHLRTRRRVDACWTYAALHRALAGTRDTLAVEDPLRRLEQDFETTGQPPAGLDDLERRIAAAVADRLQVRAATDQPGYLLLNPCGFARRAALELDGANRPLPIGGPVKACQLDGATLRAVVEVPALGFVWLPREGPVGTAPMAARLRLGDQTSLSVRNEFFEAEVDPTTGGLRAIRDHRTRMNRLGQQLVFNPGSRMVAKEIKVTSAGPALGEIVSTGELLSEHNQVLATFRQRLRAWMGRPLLEMRIELDPVQPPAGYAWHAYYGARFAWRDERLPVVRGFNGTGHVTTHPRPQTPDYLEVREPPANVVLFPGGLPFHHRQGGRMADVILVPEGEKQTVFELGISLDREQPMQTALGYASPLAVVPTLKGPPHVGASGWLFHVDASNLMLTRLVPGTLERSADGPEPRDAVTARFLECAGYSGYAEFRCVRDPHRAVVLDARGGFLLQAGTGGDAVHLEVSPNDLVHVQVEFS